MTMIRRSICYLCGAELRPLDGATGIQEHPRVDWCLTDYTDAWGVPIDDLPTPDSDDDVGVRGDGDEIPLQIFPTVESVLVETFDELGLPRLGGASTGRGWSSYALFQRCPYAWFRRHLDTRPKRMILGGNTEPESLAIGSLVHLFLALTYSQGTPNSPYRNIDLDELHDRIKRRCKPEVVSEAWRLYQGYAIYYSNEVIGQDIIPLAVELDARDPRTGESCRWDLVAFFPRETSYFRAGTYVVEHKTAQRFDRDTLDGWANDGEVLGEVTLWRRLGFDRRFGELRGVIVNIIGKQKEQKFHRTIVAPQSLMLDDHARSLNQWDGLIALARSTGIFPKARGNCINRWGRCEHWDHCAMEET